MKNRVVIMQVAQPKPEDVSTRVVWRILTGLSSEISVALPRNVTKLPSSGGAMWCMVRGSIMHCAARTDDRFSDCVVVCRDGRTDLTFVWHILVMHVAQSRTSVMAFYMIGEPAMFPSRSVGILKFSNRTIRTAGILWKKLMQMA